jgi:hypothetical protein
VNKLNSLKKYFTSSVIARIIASILLFVALSNLPIGYYKFLRWVVCSTAFYLTYITFIQNKKINFGVWIFGLIGILFNPIIPFYIGKSNWKIADLIVGIIFISSIFFVSEKRS